MSDSNTIRLVFLSSSDYKNDPYENSRAWLAEDASHGYICCRTLDLESPLYSNKFGDADNIQTLEEAIDRIIALNTTGTFIKVVKEIHLDNP